MTYSLPKLTAILLAVGLAILGIYSAISPYIRRAASAQHTDANTIGTETSDGSSASTVPAGQAWVESAVTAISRQNSIAVKLRVRTLMFKNELIGQGNYLQLGGDPDCLVKLELKMQVGEKVSSVQQVCDGRFLWSRRDLGEKIELSRVDLRTVRRALDRHHTATQTTNPLGAIGFGGLPRLLAGLAENFQFSAAQSGRLNEVPVLVLQGTWKPEQLALMLPEHAETIKAGGQIKAKHWPEYLPHEVQLVLDKQTLFPYRIEYQRRTSNEPDANIVPIVTVELHSVQLGIGIDPLVFSYKPGDKEVADRTEAFLKSLGITRNE